MRRSFAAAGFLLLMVLRAGGAAAGPADAPSTGVAISRLQNNDRVVDTRLQITGTSPAGVLVSVSIVDSNPLRTGVVHPPGTRADGAVTSNADGLWTLVPATIVPGDYDVFAAYTADGRTYQATRVRFVLTKAPPGDGTASSGWPWKLGATLLVCSWS